VRVLLVPGGGASVAGYFTALEQSLAPHATLVMVDPPGLDVASGRRWLRPADHARWLADALRQDGAEPVLVLGHSLGCLVALRLALDEPELVVGLLLLDPGPPIFGALLPWPVLRTLGAIRSVARRRRSARHPRAVPLHVRLRWYVSGSVGLAADIAAGGLSGIPTVLVTAGEHAPASLIPRTHERIVQLIPGATRETWEGTTHGLHPEEPARVAETALRLLRERCA
jgi:pimeloyl-ACP methyl ester carboxylesterase